VMASLHHARVLGLVVFVFRHTVATALTATSVFLVSQSSAALARRLGQVEPFVWVFQGLLEGAPADDVLFPFPERIVPDRVGNADAQPFAGNRFADDASESTGSLPRTQPPPVGCHLHFQLLAQRVAAEVVVNSGKLLQIQGWLAAHNVHAGAETPFPERRCRQKDFVEDTRGHPFGGQSGSCGKHAMGAGEAATLG